MDPNSFAKPVEYVKKEYIMKQPTAIAQAGRDSVVYPTKSPLLHGLIIALKNEVVPYVTAAITATPSANSTGNRYEAPAHKTTTAID